MIEPGRIMIADEVAMAMQAGIAAARPRREAIAMMIVLLGPGDIVAAPARAAIVVKPFILEI